MDEKGPEQSNNNIVLKPNLNTALKVRRIKDDLINTLDFRHKSEIAVYRIQWEPYGNTRPIGPVKQIFFAIFFLSIS